MWKLQTPASPYHVRYRRACPVGIVAAGQARRKRGRRGLRGLHGNRETKGKLKMHRKSEIGRAATLLRRRFLREVRRDSEARISRSLGGRGFRRDAETERGALVAERGRAQVVGAESAGRCERGQLCRNIPLVCTVLLRHGCNSNSPAKFARSQGTSPALTTDREEKGVITTINTPNWHWLSLFSAPTAPDPCASSALRDQRSELPFSAQSAPSAFSGSALCGLCERRLRRRRRAAPNRKSERRNRPHASHIFTVLRSESRTDGTPWPNRCGNGSAENSSSLLLPIIPGCPASVRSAVAPCHCRPAGVPRAVA